MRAGGHDEANIRSTLHIRKRLKRASLNGLTSSAACSCKFNNQDYNATSAKLKFVAAFERIWPSHLKHTRLKLWCHSAKQNGTMSSFLPSDFSTTVLVLSFIIHIQSCINIQPCGAPQVTPEWLACAVRGSITINWRAVVVVVLQSRPPHLARRHRFRIIITTIITHGRVNIKSATYSRGPGFISRPGDRLSPFRNLVVVIIVYRHMPKKHLQSGNGCFLSYPSQIST